MVVGWAERGFDLLRKAVAGGLVVVAVTFAVGPSVGVDLARAEPEVFTYRASNGVQHFTNVPSDRRFRAFSPPPRGLVLASATQRRDGGPQPIPSRASDPELLALIEETADRFGLDPALIHAMVRAESGFDSEAVSAAGAGGLMQLMPETARAVGVEDVFHPASNLAGGATYLRRMLDRFDGDLELALAAYNAGPSAVDEHGGIPPFAETQQYLGRVMRFRQEYIDQAYRRPETVAALPRR